MLCYPVVSFLRIRVQIVPEEGEDGNPNVFSDRLNRLLIFCYSWLESCAIPLPFNSCSRLCPYLTITKQEVHQ